MIRVLSKVSSIVLSELRNPENRGQVKSYLYIKKTFMSDPLCIQRIELYDAKKAFEQEYYQPGMIKLILSQLCKTRIIDKPPLSPFCYPVLKLYLLQDKSEYKP